MKVRNGFVSNSSSSSFVVVFPDGIPASANDVLILLFGAEALDPPDVEIYDCKLSKLEIAAMVWEDIEYQTKNAEVRAELIDTARNGTDYALEDAIAKFLGPEPDWDKPESRDDYQIYHDLKYKLTEGVSLYRAVEKIVRSKVDYDGDDRSAEAQLKRAEFWQEQTKYRDKLDEFHWTAVVEEIGDNEFYVFHYGDSHGDRRSVVLEHGGIFNRLKHWRFSHH